MYFGRIRYSKGKYVGTDYIILDVAVVKFLITPCTCHQSIDHSNYDGYDNNYELCTTYMRPIGIGMNALIFLTKLVNASQTMRCTTTDGN